MGLADLPRAYFSGFTYWNPSTMNNNDYQPTYDPASATLNWSWLERRGLRDPAEFDAYVTGLGIAPAANDILLDGLDTTAPPAEWNFHGDNSCGFVQVDQPVIEWPARFSKPASPLVVTGYADPGGDRVSQGDPWIGLPLSLNQGLHPAKLVDVDPVCPWSSQLFADTVTLGSGSGDEPGFTGATAGRAHSRWVFFARNLNASHDVIIAGVASSMWQLALPRDGLTIAGTTGSALATRLAGTLKKPNVRGLMLRFVTYHTVYFQGPAFEGHPRPNWPAITGLYAEYARAQTAYERGERETAPPPPVNRAYSDTVGWLAPWTTADMRSMATGRILHSPGPVRPLDGQLKPTPLGPAAVECATDPADPQRVTRLAIDLGSAVPELDSALTKVDFGTLTLSLSGRDQPLAAIPYAGGYDAPTYRASAGVIDIALNPTLTVDELQGGELSLTTAGGQTALSEVEYTAETDDRATYLDEPAGGEPPRAISVQVRRRGAKPPPGTRLAVAQYSPAPPGFNEGAWELVSAEPAAQGPFLTLSHTDIEVPVHDDGLPYGEVAVGVRALRSGPPILRFVAGAPGVPPAPPPPTVGFGQITQQFFANVRVLPFHGALAVAFENWLATGPSVDLVTQRVFDTVFRTFFMMYPAMRFLRDPLRFQARRGQICAVTDPAVFETAAYMPVTRSLSSGQRRILELWDRYLDGELATPVREGPSVRRG